jgi:prolyl-tRNA editing enzyme YbaK/EbsC (Cys-tRNA(Pro) deacylase)
MKPDQNLPLNPDEIARLERLRQILDEAEATYEIFSHAEMIHSAQDGVESGMGNLAEMAPTLILDTEEGPIAAIISGETRLSYKKVKRALGLKNVCLAKPDAVLEHTEANVGTVSLVNPGMPTIVDDSLLKAAYVYGGCGVPRYTLRIPPLDLVRVTRARVFHFTELKG